MSEIERRVRALAVLVAAALAIAIALWLLRRGLSPGRVGAAALLSLPLWLALPRLYAGVRRQYAWMTLALTPYLCGALVETIANPDARAWAGSVLLLSFTLFVLLIAYLRVSRESAVH